VIRLTPFFTAIVLVSSFAYAAERPLPEKIVFNRDVRPILSENCFKCHGPDQKARKAERRLDTRDGALVENEGIRAIVPGSLGASEMHVRIHSEDNDERMPPLKSGKKITPRQIAILDKWIEQGAEYQAHWAYLAPVKAPVPQIDDAAFVKNPIDSFVLARQRQLGLAHAPEADARTLCRRLYFDLTGLPPKPEDVDAFAADSIGNLSDRLLASPAFGERLAVYWLDVVRYADSIGFHSDNPRNVWPYRDYVIRAFNENKPFDQFTIEQLGGDLIPNATLAQKVASTFNRLNLTTEEGGAQAKDYEARTVADRVRAIGTVWLAQTTGCAQCHDHKFDPITARDFYSLGAFFADINEAAIGGRGEGALVPGPEDEARLKEFDTQITALRQRIEAPSPELAAAQAAWEQALAEGPKDAPWTGLQPEKASGEKNSQLVVRADGTIKIEVEGSPAADTYLIEMRLPKGATGVKLEVLPSASLPANGPGRAPNGNFVLNEIRLERAGQNLKFADATATFEQPNFPAKNAIDGVIDQPSNGWAVMGNTGKASAAYFELAEPFAEDTVVTFRLTQNYGTNHMLGKFRLSATAAQKPIRAPNTAAPAEVLAAIKVPSAERKPEQTAFLAKHFRSIAPQLKETREQLAAKEKERGAFEKSLPHCLVSEHTDQPRTVRLLPRGDWLNETGEVMQPAVLHFLPQPKAEGRLTRLDLGRWLVARENPLTGRVFVNRLWKLFFGTGLSKVLDDLGTQGETPVNPELLDWLACEFMDSGWDVKHVVRLIVTSGTYRQSSQVSPEMQQRDPLNRELTHQTRFRLDAEFVRDNALAVSGLLVTRVGGPSVKPYQPAGYWENLNFPTREWQADNGEAQYRRGLYTWWQRSYLQPSLLAFDSPSREECVAERNRSNIPQQALVLLNDPTYVEAARVFAARILRECAGDNAQRITWAMRQALGRAPREDEMAALGGLLQKHTTLYTSTPEAATALLKTGIAPLPEGANIGELAAWTSVARAVLNLHETMTRM
jgi:hypothetical protein